jgi:hypothetical protein
VLTDSRLERSLEMGEVKAESKTDGGLREELPQRHLRRPAVPVDLEGRSLGLELVEVITGGSSVFLQLEERRKGKKSGRQQTPKGIEDVSCGRSRAGPSLAVIASKGKSGYGKKLTSSTSVVLRVFLFASAQSSSKTIDGGRPADCLDLRMRGIMGRLFGHEGG